MNADFERLKIRTGEVAMYRCGWNSLWIARWLSDCSGRRMAFRECLRRTWVSVALAHVAVVSISMSVFDAAVAEEPHMDQVAGAAVEVIDLLATCEYLEYRN